MDVGTAAPSEATADAVQPPASPAPSPAPDPVPVEAPAAVAEVPAPAHVCADCGRSFSTANGLGGHRSYCEAAGGARAPTTAAPPAPAAVVVDGQAAVPGKKPRKGKAPAKPGELRDGAPGADPHAELVDQLRTLAALRPSDVARALCQTVLPPDLTEREAQLLDSKLSGWHPPPWLDTALVVASIFGPRVWMHPAVQATWQKAKAEREAAQAAAAAQAERAAMAPAPVPVAPRPHPAVAEPARAGYVEQL